MSFSSGTFSINSSGQPVVTGTVISSTAFNALTADLATGLSTCMLKDGTQTMTANIPMAGFKFTGLGAGSVAGNSLRYEQLFDAGTVTLLGALTTPGNISTTGTGTITSAGNLTASAHTVFEGVTSTGATGTGKLVYDTGPTLSNPIVGTQTAADNSTKAASTAYVDTNKVVVRAAQATTSGAAWDFTSIPSWATNVVLQMAGFSTNGTSVPIVQLGTSGSPVATGYLGTGSSSAGGNTIGTAQYTTGFGIGSQWANTYIAHGRIHLSRLDATNFVWTCTGFVAQSEAAQLNWTAGSKTMSAALDMIRLTMVNGTDAGDAGTISAMYW